MQHNKLVCVDIESVPDRTLMPDDWPEGKFPKPIWHRVVAISFVEARIDRVDGVERFSVTCCRSGGEADWGERRLLSGFWQHFAQNTPRVVTWNGKGFDLPVLRARAMVHALSARCWYQSGSKWETYAQRYAPDWHCDLMEQLSDYRACAPMGMDDVATALGLPGKIGGHGSQVDAMVKRGELDAVRAYCECDCLNLFAIYLRWALLSGRTDQAGYDASLESLSAYLEREREVRQHFGTFLDGWGSHRRQGAPAQLS